LTTLDNKISQLYNEKEYDNIVIFIHVTNKTTRLSIDGNELYEIIITGYETSLLNSFAYDLAT